MKLILISSPRTINDEHKILTELFREGLELFHLRKPKSNKRALKNYILKIPAEYRDRVVIHGSFSLAEKCGLKGVHLTEKQRKKRDALWKGWRLFKRSRTAVSTSFHSLDPLINYDEQFRYVFLSPVFGSISKIGYNAKFNYDRIKNVLTRSKQNVIALGGVDESRIEKAKELGFKGVALLGAIWKSELPVDNFISINEKIKSSMAIK